MLELGPRVADLSPEKRDLLTLLLRKKKEGQAPQDVIPRREDLSVYPLSFAQRRLWFLEQMEPGNPFYNISAALRLTGPLNIHAFHQSLNDIFRRHEVLRMVYRSVDGNPIQVIGASAEIPMPQIDLSTLPASDRLADAIRRAVEESRRPFDLSAGPMVRTNLLRLSEGDHVALVTFHHIVFDGWSTGVLLKELSSLYAAHLHGETPRLPELPVQYADFACWQQRTMEGEALQHQLSFWKEYLKDATSPLELPSDHARPVGQSYNGVHCPFTLPRDLYRSLQALSREEGATLFMTLLAAFQLLLHRYAAQANVSVGIPMANRTRKEIQGLIGFFVNTLVVRADFSGPLSFRQLLRQVRNSALAAYANQETPFEKVVEALLSNRALSHSPLFQVLFDLQKSPLRGLDLGDLRISLLEVENGTAKFDLSLIMTEGTTDLTGVLEYNSSLFDPPTIGRMVQHFETHLREIVRKPDDSIMWLSTLTDDERRHLLHEWTNTKSEYHRDLCIHQLVEQQAYRTPDAIAVCSRELSLSYRELNSRANRLARYLQKRGVRPRDVVGVCLDRSPELVVALFGALKAGCTYLPLDPTYPGERLAFMLHDAHAALLVTHSRFGNLVPADLSPSVMVDTVWEAAAGESDENLAPLIGPEDLAYVIYTSGSTGVPKGTEIEHRGLVNLVRWHQGTYEVTPSDRATLIAGTAFDASVWEMWPYLASGASLHIPDPDTRESAENLVEWFVARQISIAFLPTPLAEAVLGVQWPPASCLRYLLTGGDRLHVWGNPATSFTLVNHYGPTEYTVVTTSTSVPCGPAEGNPPIGRPIANTRTFVLDRNGALSPIGVPGELCIGGEGLARGYLHRPDLTAERFVPNPYSDQPGERLYRTGDLVRHLADGTLQFIGRIDQQVKLRGFRIELGEIEATLHQHPGLRDAIVAAREELSGEKRLVAYIVAQPGTGVNARDFRTFLETKLPGYMIPASFVMMDSLPLTPNGKVDRKALPAPGLEPADDQPVAPRTPTEEILANIWADVLRARTVGTKDNFFALGGHSLLATQVLSRVRSAFHVNLPLKSLFEYPTLHELSNVIEKERGKGRASSTPEVGAHDNHGEFPLSFAQERLWFLDQLEPGNPQYNIAGGMRLRGVFDASVLSRCLDALARRHAVLRTTFPTIEGRAIQRVSPALALPLTLVDGRDWVESERELKTMETATAAAREPFHLAEGPLLRAVLIRLSEEDHVAVFVMHHIISDGWSMGILLRELAVLYRSFVMGTDPALPDLPIQYKDYAAWQRNWMSGEELQKELEYWKQALTGAPAQLELPLDHPRPPVQTTRGSQYRFALTPALSQAVKDFSRKAGATLFMTLLAPFQLLLNRYADEDDICVGIPIANRNSTKTEDLVGLFVNTVVIRTDLSGNPTAKEVLHRIRDAVLGAHEHQDVPFEKVVDALEPERNMSRTPLFQAMFTLQNASESELEFPGMVVTPLAIDAGVSPFDLTLTMESEGDRFVGVLEYNCDLFNGTTITRLGSHYERILEACVAHPDVRIGALSMISGDEQRTVVHDWNQTGVDSSPRTTVHRLVEEQVRRTPDALAVKHGGQTMSYDQVNRRANILAHHLRRLGAGPEVRIGICIERSVDAIVGLLAILKSGGAYVPLDPRLPADRLAFMIADAGINILLTQTGSPPGVSVEGMSTILVDAPPDGGMDQDRENPSNITVAENLAYVIYTSGTTGRPKGVLINHRSMCNHNRAAAAAFALTNEDRVLQFASLSFDAAVEEIFPAWIRGAAVILRNDDALGGGKEFLEFIERERITVLDLPTAFWSEWTHTIVRSNITLPSCLRLVVVGGDVVPVERYREWQSTLPQDVRWLNTYGPTEATVIATSYEPERQQEGGDAESDIPIGRPISNAEVYILDRFLQPVPVGVPGEIFIGGEGVARGYHNRPDRTAEKFVPDGLSGRRGARFYRTGDRGCYRFDGQIRFLGRIDDQVKIRGFRVEPGEIERAISTHPQVRDVAVLTRTGEAGKRLVAYCVHDTGASVTRADLRHFLTGLLPDYMIPSSFVFLESLPRTHTGKVDRTAILKSAKGREDEPSSVVEPATPEENALVEIWKRVLGRERIGVTDNFFELGGDSILSIQIVAKAQAAGLHITPKDLFQNPTINALATVAGRVQERICEQGSISGDAPLTPIQRWFFDQGFSEPAHWNQSLLVQVQHQLKRTVLEDAVRGILRHHDMLRARFHRTADGWVQNILPEESAIPFTAIDLTHSLPGQEQKVIEEYTARMQGSLDLEIGPIFRVAYFDFGEERSSRLLFVFHHLIIDGVSWRIVLEDFMSAYQSLERGEAAIVPPKSTSYKAWSERLGEYASSDVLKDEVRYWSNLSTLRWKAGPIPTDFEGGANTYDSAERVIIELTPEETETLVRDVPRMVRAKVDEVLLTAFVRAASAWTGRSTLFIDMESHGRAGLWGDIDLSRSVGWFTSSFPMSVEVNCGRHWRENLTAVQSQMRRVPNNGIGFGVLKYLAAESGIATRLRKIAPPEISFNYLGRFDNLLSGLSGFGLAPESPGPEHSPTSNRTNLLDVMARIVESRLEVVFEYSRQIHHRHTIDSLAESFTKEMRCILAESASLGGKDDVASAQEEEEFNSYDLQSIIPEEKGTLDHG